MGFLRGARRGTASLAHGLSGPPTGGITGTCAAGCSKFWGNFVLQWQQNFWVNPAQTPPPRVSSSEETQNRGTAPRQDSQPPSSHYLPVDQLSEIYFEWFLHFLVRTMCAPHLKRSIARIGMEYVLMGIAILALIHVFGLMVK